MSKTNRDYTTGLYQTLLARQPDSAGLDYYSQRLDSGFFTRAQVAYTFLTCPEYNHTAETVARLYLAAFKRIPDIAGLQFWQGVLINGGSVAQIAQIFTQTSEFASLYGTNLDSSQFLDILYSNVLGRSADASGKSYWLQQLAGGMSKGDALDNFAQSPELQAKTASSVMTALLYSVLADRMPTNAELAAAPTNLEQLTLKAAQAAGVVAVSGAIVYSGNIFSEADSNNGSIANTITLTLSGDTFKGNVGANLGKVSNAPSGLTASLTKTGDTTATLSLVGTAKDHGSANNIGNLTVALSNADFTSGAANLVSGAAKSDLKISFIDLPIKESDGTLSASGPISSALSVDLATDKMMLGTTAISLVSGDISHAVNVDMSNLIPATSTTTASKTTVSVSIKGDDQANRLSAAGYPTTLEGGKGNDTIVCGSSTDTLVFSSTADGNGVDTVSGFSLGKGGDVLKFSAFLNKTGTANIAALSAASTAAKAWSNGDVLVIQGNGLDASALAGLFGAGKVFAAPTEARKAVLISADIVGDASVWYLTNQTDTAAITSTEITLVGTLKGINNLALLGFDTSNLA